MRVNRLSRVRVIAITLFALLFAQWSVAAYACPTLLPREAAMPAGCEEMTTLDQAAPNLCAEHCHFGEQSDQPRPPTTPAVLLVALYEIHAPTVSAPIRTAFDADGRLIAPSPPPNILHCRFLI